MIRKASSLWLKFTSNSKFVFHYLQSFLIFEPRILIKIVKSHLLMIYLNPPNKNYQLWSNFEIWLRENYLEWFFRLIIK